MTRHYDPNDTSTVRKYLIEESPITSSRDCFKDCAICNVETNAGGYLFEIYDEVIDAPAVGPVLISYLYSSGPEHPIVTDARLITTVFICDDCYRKKTVPN